MEIYMHPTEREVNKILASAASKQQVLEARIKNLPSDKGPQLKPDGGPLNYRTKGAQKVKLEKQIHKIKADTLQKVEKVSRNAPPDVKSNCNRAIDKWQYGEVKAGEKAPMEQKQAHLAQWMHERKQGPPDQKAHKSLDQSGEHLYRKRYGKDAPEPVQKGEQRPIDRADAGFQKKIDDYRAARQSNPPNKTEKTLNEPVSKYYLSLLRSCDHEIGML